MSITKKMTTRMVEYSAATVGVDLLATDDTVGDSTVIDQYGPVEPEVRRAIILEKAAGTPTKLVSFKYQVPESSVKAIYSEFVASTRNVRHISEMAPDEYRSAIRRKALTAIENGLECDRDPYRQAAVGLKVMDGIGEFKGSQQGANVTINALITAVPDDWKGRYISASTGSQPPKQLTSQGDSDASRP